MKRILLYWILSAALLNLSLSCTKEEPAISTIHTISVPLGRNETYRYDLGLFGDEEGAVIRKQASHFLVSQAVRDIATGKIVYTYTPAPDYAGTDEVELKSMRGSDGASANNEITITTIQFTISK